MKKHNTKWQTKAKTTTETRKKKGKHTETYETGEK